MKRNIKRPSLFRITDGFLPLTFLACSLLGRGSVAFQLFLCVWTVRLCAFSTASGLRSTLSMQPVGALIAFAACKLLYNMPSYCPLVAVGLMINIEHVFYEYLYAIGEHYSARLYRGISSILILTGILLSAPPHGTTPIPASWSFMCLAVTSLIPVWVGIAVAAALGGRPGPRLSIDLFRYTPSSMLRTLLYPTLIMLIRPYIQLEVLGPIPFFAGLLVCELCQTPFRRSPSECKTMNRTLVILSIVAAASLYMLHMGVIFFLDVAVKNTLAGICGSLLCASMCAFGLYGNFSDPGGIDDMP